MFSALRIWKTADESWVTWEALNVRSVWPKVHVPPAICRKWEHTQLEDLVSFTFFSEDSIDFQILTHVRNMSISYKKIKIPKNNNNSFQIHLLKGSLLSSVRWMQQTCCGTRAGAQRLIEVASFFWFRSQLAPSTGYPRRPHLRKLLHSILCAIALFCYHIGLNVISGFQAQIYFKCYAWWGRININIWLELFWEYIH